jgi:menaquinone-9 beta-reductase
VSIWDLIVVGAGPAGCAAAAAALGRDPQARVLLIDKASFPRDKACGDGIAGGSVEMLSSLGLPAARIVRGYEPVNDFRVRSPGNVQVSRRMPEPVWVIPRVVFDARLLEAVLELGARFTQTPVRTVDQFADQVVVDGVLRGKALVGADGAESVVRRAAGHPLNPQRSLAIAIRGYGPELDGQDGAQLIVMTAKHWPAYAWSFPIGHGRANIGYGQVLRGGPVSKASLVQELHTLLPGATPEPGSLRAHRLPMSTTRPAVARGRIMLAGDAQSLINPLTGEGIYYALTSGALAGQCAGLGAQAGSAYRRMLTRRLGRYLRHASVLAFLTRWPSLMDSVLRGAANNQNTFEDLVRLGLQDGTITRRLLGSALTPRNWRSRMSVAGTPLASNH